MYPDAEYRPTPNSNDARLAVHTAGSRMIRMSISGAADLSSIITQAAPISMALTSSTVVVTEPQPYDAPVPSASSRHHTRAAHIADAAS
jgi:hypothetical protein